MYIFNYLYQKIGDNIQIHTNGCDICIYDARKFANTLPKNEKAIVYNTCSVFGIRETENKLLLKLLNTAFPDYQIYVLGCDVNNNPEQYQKYDNVYANEEVQKIIETDNIDDYAQTNEPLIYIKVQDGCPHNCSFCIINKLRSHPYSVPYRRIVETVTQQVTQNSRVEIAGTELTCYFDEETGYNLVEMLSHLIEDVPNIGRITLTSIDPHPPLTKDLIKLVGLHRDKFVPHLVLAVQSGSDKILKLMNRRHTVAEIRELHKLADFYKVSLGWDIIVGFPGETESEFLDTYNLMNELQPLTQTIFAYSPREGTPAFNMPNQVSDIEKEKRLVLLQNKMKKYATNHADFNNYAEYTEELTKYEQVNYIKEKITNLLLSDECTIHYVNLNKVNEIAKVIRNPQPNDIISVNFEPKNALKHEIYINFFKEFIPDVPIIVHMPVDYNEDTEEFERVYHCKVVREYYG
jgi:threonylcarbamoyladenosine tRNA methylthiotransferase MtaB